MTKRNILTLLAALLSILPAMAYSETVNKLTRGLNYAGKADSLETALTDNFLNKQRGYFYSTPQDVEHSTTYIYWQQAHAMDVLAYSYERKLKEGRTAQAELLKRYMEAWYANHANNYHRDSNDRTGFLNPYTDDMAWIGLSLLRLSEVLGDGKYAQTAREVYDQHIITRAIQDETGMHLPWNWDRDETGNYKNPNGGACTHSPACLLAAKLYQQFEDEKYLTDATALYDFMVKQVCLSDGRCEEPPLSYTQGTFGEACRQLYHITGRPTYKTAAAKYLRYAINSDRCCDRGLLRHEGESMDQSIFKAVLIPYLVNFALDTEVCPDMYRKEVVSFLLKNADALWSNLDKEAYPKMYCPYYWGSRYDKAKTASMVAMVSGASLLEQVARLCSTINGIAVPITAASDGKGQLAKKRPAQSKGVKPTTYPIDEYEEPRVGTIPNTAEWEALSEGLHLTWANRDLHYALHQVPRGKEKASAQLRAWKGERANIEAVLFSKRDQGELRLRMTAWRKKDGRKTGIKTATARFMNYVITDDYKSCGNHDMSLSPWLVPDIIDQDKPRHIPAMETRPVWCTVEVPRRIESGEYTTTLEVVDPKGRVQGSLDLHITVLDRSLPEVHDQQFHLDLWQQPYAVSRYYGVERWSKGHIKALRPYLQALARAGQKVVSTIMFYEPWGNQTHDKFSPMIASTRHADGSWSYDYSIFDRYVSLCAEYGIDQQINCYSMVPWDMTFRYYDEAEGREVDLKTTTSSTEYKDLWEHFLQAFRKHLEKKGWFEKTCIAMDERAEADMLNAYAIAHAAGFKMALAGNYHASLNDKLQDFCVAFNQAQRFTAEERAYRDRHGLTTTVYTSCADVEPNIYSCSLPAEAAFLPLYVAAHRLSGYLHWSWMNWDEHPLTDSRFRLFGSGDTYCYYPGNRSSVRFERLIEGIQQYEKIRILQEEWKDGDQRLSLLNRLLALCQDPNTAGRDCASLVSEVESLLNSTPDEERMMVAPQTLFSTLAGNIDTPPYRIPGICRGQDGRLIATAARLVCGTDPGYGQVDVVCRISTDNGKTWSPEREVAVGTGITSATTNYFDTSFGDPAVVADRESGEVLVMAVAGCTVFSHPTTNRQNPNLIAAIRSMDGGETWQQPENQTEAIYQLFDDGNRMDAAFVGGGRIFQSRVVKQGRYYRLYAALAAKPNGNRVIYSDDFGRTWKPLGGKDAAPVPNGDEPKCDELPDGRVIITSRTGGGRYYNIFSYSDLRSGTGTWEKQTHCDFADACRTPSTNPTNGEMLVVPARQKADGKPVHLILQSMPMGPGRSNVAIYYKVLENPSEISCVDDLCRGWDGYYQVSHTASAYSSMEQQADGRIAIFYEETLTKWGTKPNPISTTFPTGQGQHNFDGFENIYLPLTLETITSGQFGMSAPTRP